MSSWSVDDDHQHHHDRDDHHHRHHHYYQDHHHHDHHHDHHCLHVLYNLKADHLIRPRDELKSSLFLFLPYTFLYTRSLEINMVNFLQISVSHQAL